MSELLTQRVEGEMRARAIRGEPEPGTYICGRCGRDDARMYTIVTGNTEADAIRNHGEMNRADLNMRLLPGADMRGMLLCPCCSFAELSGCPHQPLDPRCPACHLSTLPTGTLPTGGPFVRCDGPESHA